MENQRWKEIPRDIIYLIIEYDGRFKKRNGVYMTQIPTSDVRYNILRTIPRKKFHKFCYYEIKISYRYETYVHFPSKKYYICFVETTSCIKHYVFKGSMIITGHKII
jgi:hypothetical protein